MYRVVAILSILLSIISLIVAAKYREYDLLINQMMVIDRRSDLLYDTNLNRINMSLLCSVNFNQNILRTDNFIVIVFYYVVIHI